MRVVSLALTEKRRIECEAYLFPAEYYDIPGVEDFEDLDAVVRYGIRQMKPYAGEKVELYLNGGMSAEVLCTLQAAQALNISVTVMHYDSHKGSYIPQEVKWKAQRTVRKENLVMLALCEGRHVGTIDSFIFKAVSDDQIFDFSWQEEQVRKCMEPLRQQPAGIYLSGLTALYISVLNVAGQLEIPVTFFHYNYDTEDYFPQIMDRIPRILTPGKEMAGPREKE